MFGEPFHVSVLDDDADITRLCRTLLGSVGYSVESFERVADFVRSGRMEQAGVLLTDVRMPERSGLEIVDELAAMRSPLRVVVMSGHADVSMAVRALKSGAVDFLEKPFRPQDLLDAVSRARGHAATAAREAAERTAVLSRMSSLTRREREVFLQVVAGRANREVAAELKLSAKTVEIHRAGVMRKMHAQTFADLVRMAVVAEAEGAIPALRPADGGGVMEPTGQSGVAA
ncbi:MAG: response regulator [Planctomycetaceae bacterium]|jgi:FixJ family two-component response regulator|nr:response regulator transcription factor [Phycisphaerales bacterium]MCE2653014.1 response regulator [Planctomycetaceae bacterium]